MKHILPLVLVFLLQMNIQNCFSQGVTNGTCPLDATAALYELHQLPSLEGMSSEILSTILVMRGDLSSKEMTSLSGGRFVKVFDLTLGKDGEVWRDVNQKITWGRLEKATSHAEAKKICAKHKARLPSPSDIDRLKWTMEVNVFEETVIEDDSDGLHSVDKYIDVYHPQAFLQDRQIPIWLENGQLFDVETGLYLEDKRGGETEIRVFDYDHYKEGVPMETRTVSLEKDSSQTLFQFMCIK